MYATRVPKNTYPVRTEHVLSEYCRHVKHYQTAVAGVLHCTRSLAWVVSWSCIMHDDEAWHVRIKLTTPQLPFGSHNPKGHTSISKEMGLVLDLG